MSRWRLVLLIALLIASLTLAFLLQDVIHLLVTVPLSYLAWRLALIYRAVPQFLTWAILVLFVCIAVIWQFIPDVRPAVRNARGRPVLGGQVEFLAVWIHRAHGSNYFKWLLANRLGRAARRLQQLSGSRQDAVAPSRAIGEYLTAGLDHSFVDFPAPRHRFERRTPTPLDQDPREVVAYIESQMETDHDGDARGL